MEPTLYPAPIITIGGIIKLTLGPYALEAVGEHHSHLPEVAVPLREEDLHITLWKLSKDERRRFEANVRLDVISVPGYAPEVMLEPGMHRIHRPERVIDGRRFVSRTSWILLVKERDQQVLRDLVNRLAHQVGMEPSEYELRRPFHVSVGNLTGSPFDSIGDVEWSDIREDMGISTDPERLPSGASGPMAALKEDAPAFSPEGNDV